MFKDYFINGGDKRGNINRHEFSVVKFNNCGKHNL